MATQEKRSTGQEQTVQAAEDTATDITVLAAATSVVLALYQFFVRGNRMQGIFIGLWPPTILAFASYNNQKRIEEAVMSLGPNRIVNSIEKVLSNR
ncbi:hypothetical protein [Halorussus pelagicus]|uniref:hypothetical protein n=1 Tax=Halorussus pelagicus TaxID=2505977 RepID=UPI001FB6EE87|nr:hypothetical protein [Halorussus pelagicus]